MVNDGQKVEYMIFFYKNRLVMPINILNFNLKIFNYEAQLFSFETNGSNTL